MKIKYFLVFISLLINIVNAQNIQFEQVIPPPPAPQNDANFDAVRAGTIAFADIDNDNDQDVLITGTNNLNQNIAKLYNNDGAGNFAEITGTPFSGGIAGAFAFADVDNDNDQDVIITGTSSDSSKLYTNDGSVTPPTESGPESTGPAGARRLLKSNQ